MKLTDRVKRWELEADSLHRAAYGVSHSTLNTDRKKPYEPPICFTARNSSQLDALVSAFNASVGMRGRGNGRTGSTRYLYADLVNCFFTMQQNGLKLPRWSISKKHASLCLFNILQTHGYIDQDTTIQKFNNTPTLRAQAHNKLARVFQRVADAVENTPAKILPVDTQKGY